MALRSFSGFPQSHSGVEARKHGFPGEPTVHQRAVQWHVVSATRACHTFSLKSDDTVARSTCASALRHLGGPRAGGLVKHRQTSATGQYSTLGGLVRVRQACGWPQSSQEQSSRWCELSNHETSGGSSGECCRSAAEASPTRDPNRRRVVAEQAFNNVHP